MFSIFTNVLTQVLVLFVLILLGVIIQKAKIFKGGETKGITDFVLTFVTPCVIIKSFADKDFTPDALRKFLSSFLWAFIAHIIFIIFAHLFIRTKKIFDRKILQFGTVFSNCGFMSIPLQQAIIGDTGVFYAASFIAVMNLFLWSYGAFTVSGDKKYLLSPKAVLNPGVIGLLIGLILFFTALPLPQVVYQPISYVAALNTPLPMILIGFHLANSNIFSTLKNFNCIFATLLRLIIFPALIILIIYLFGLRGDLFISLAISASAPVAAATTMFAEKFGGNTPLSANLVSISTLLSLITMPIIITIASYFA
ncbi:MAG: AEC family transporter [Clostridia bacterium]|nr:AEC family transporter [Clostridia bacterium]